jgi:enoyl-CoA hydratase/carnithine racemase
LASETPSGATVRVELRGQVAVVAIDHPPVNLLHPDVAAQIGAVVDELAQRTDVRCLVITGTGRHFVGGGDLRFVQTLDARAAERYVTAVQAMQLGLSRAPQPVIAAVNGTALGGGCELAMACDIRISADDALWGQPEVTLGIIPGAGGTQNLPRLVGPGRAKRLVFTGERITAQRALEIGLVDEVVAPDLVLDTAVALGRAIAANAPLAVRAAKRAIDLGMQMSIEDALHVEAALFAPLVDTEDFAEGSTAFFAKQKPEFKGK